MTVIWAFPDSNVASLTAHRMAKNAAKSDAIERAVSEACRSRNIIGAQAEVCHDAATEAYMDGASPAAAVAAGVKKAEQIVRDRICVRNRGFEPDDAA